ncbi:PAS domain-containing methyl-accepting chemotaxis protein [Pseudomonas sp.]|uniref:methyl-accepting chemotaxis protein n=1 Tax=Pseudomonas sp. TaxID=306 RepID=UPI001A066817|nr:PAS domain-containing methyl-accepting chemotaxis protein [Pseudomonas sp.]MBF0675370.1 methyl-accepting chemotaxis protein [Pseudomonas sp.]
MRLNTPITDRECSFPADQRLISATDTQGTLHYCNDEFVRVSGFSRTELLGSPHNIVRHPDMPEAVFAHMWSYLKDGRPWMGIIKNRCRNGDFYWVSAYVTPMLEEGRVVGYESVRVKPEAEQVRRAIALYASMQGGGAQVRSQRRWKPMLAPLLACVPALLAWQLGGPALGMGVALTLLFLLHGWQASRQARLLDQLQASMQGAFDSELAARVFSTMHGRPAQMQMALISEQARQRTLLSRLDDYADQAAGLAERSGGLTRETEACLQVQRSEAHQAAVAMQEMSASIGEVSAMVQRSANDVGRVNTLAEQGAEEAEKTHGLIDRLAQRVAGISDTVERLARETQSIDQAATMIRSISEQTNLLALNAAIEAARAGDHGRGFAVVAGEVRELALRTREATEAIQSVLKILHTGAGEAVAIARSGRTEADAGLTQVVAAQRALHDIRQAMGSLRDMGLQMATATEEQTRVVEEVARQIGTIAQSAENNAALAVESAQAGHELADTARAMHALVERFNR